MRKPTSKSLSIVGLVIGLLFPTVVGAATFCSKDLVGVRLSDKGRLEIRIDQAGGNAAGVLMQICNIRVQMGTFQPDTCKALYGQLLAAFHTGRTISIQFRTSALDGGLWANSCSTLTHQGDFSSAIATIETQK